MRTIPCCIFLLCFIISCSKNDIEPVEDTTGENIDESTLVFQEGFTGRKLYTNVKAILQADKSVLLAVEEMDEEELVKFNIPDQSEEWKATTWYEERAGTGNFHYQHENVILFRQGHHDFAIDLEDGSLLYDEEREDCPDARLSGTGYTYFTRWTVVDEATQDSKEIILKGDIRQAEMPEELVSPSYDTIGDNGSLGRIMGLHAFENENGEQLLAVRYFDYEPEGASTKDLFAVYNVTQEAWQVEQVPLDHHTTGTQTMVANDLIYFGSGEHVSCLDTETGILKWVTDAYTLSPNKLMAYADGAIFVYAPDGMLQRRQAETGELIWETYHDNLQQFIILNDKLFSIGGGFKITAIETGEILHSYSSPYVDYSPDNYFGNTKKLKGLYDEDAKRSYVFINSDDQMICYEIAD